MMELISRKGTKMAQAVAGETVLKLALAQDLDWGFHCKRGNCARCRSFVVSGMEHLEAPNEKELARLEPEEIEQGYRLACQTVMKATGPVTIRHKPYF